MFLILYYQIIEKRNYYNSAGQFQSNISLELCLLVFLSVKEDLSGG